MNILIEYTIDGHRYQERLTAGVLNHRLGELREVCAELAKESWELSYRVYSSMGSEPFEKEMTEELYEKITYCRNNDIPVKTICKILDVTESQVLKVIQYNWRKEVA